MRFLITYLAVFGVMLGWWLLLQVLARVGGPGLTVLVAFAAPATAWAVIAVLFGEKRHRM